MKKRTIVSILTILVIVAGVSAIYIFRNPNFEYVYQYPEYKQLENYLYFNKSNTSLKGTLWIDEVEKTDLVKLSLTNIEEKIPIPKERIDIQEDLDLKKAIFVHIQLNPIKKHIEEFLCYISLSDRCLIGLELKKVSIKEVTYPYYSYSYSQFNKHIRGEIEKWLGNNITLDNLYYFDGITSDITGQEASFADINYGNSNLTYFRNLYLYRKYNDKVDEEITTYPINSTAVYHPGMCEYILGDSEIIKRYGNLCSITEIKMFNGYNEFLNKELFKELQVPLSSVKLKTNILPIIEDLIAINSKESIEMSSTLYFEIMDDRDLYGSMFMDDYLTMFYISQKLKELDNENRRKYELNETMLRSAFTESYELLDNDTKTLNHHLTLLSFSKNEENFVRSNQELLSRYYISSNYWGKGKQGALMGDILNYEGFTESEWIYFSIPDLMKYLKVLERF